MKIYLFSSLYLCIFIALGTLYGGCAYVPTTTVGDEDKTVLENARTNDLNDASAFDPNNVLWGGTVYARKFNLNSKELERYVNTIAAKLVASWPKPVPPYSVRLIYGNNLDAHATMNNVIFLSSGWMKGSKSEDEIAAVLAHELAHILLAHPINKGSRVQSSEYLNSFRELMPLGLYVAKMRMNKEGSSYNIRYEGGSSEQKKIAASVYLGTIIYDMKQSVIDPLITRNQEEQADFLAVDLLQKAGYNSYVLRDEIMDRLLSYRENIQKEIDNKEALFKVQCKQIEEQIHNDLLAGQVNSALQSAMGTLFNQVRREFIKIYEGGQKEHFRPEIRSARLAEYLDRHYKTMPRVKKKISKYNQMIARTGLVELHNGNHTAELALEKLNQDDVKGAATLSKEAIRTRAGKSPYPWYILAKVRASQQRWPDVRENFSKAIKIGGCSPEVYSQLSEFYIDQKNYPLALRIVNKGISVFNEDPGPFYLDKAKICLAESNYVSLEKILDECQSYPDKTISVSCKQLQQNLKKNSQYADKNNKLPIESTGDLLDKLNPFKHL